MRAVIVDGLLPLATRTANLQTDPDNARRGDVEAVKRSLNVFGQRKPIVVKRTGQDANGDPVGLVIAGNHTLMAAEALGWDHVAAVFVEDDATTARAYALADNRTGELATWDYEQLSASLSELQDQEFDLDSLGWAEHELEALLGATWSPGAADDDLEGYNNDPAPTRRSLVLSDDAWPMVDDALGKAREALADPGLTDEAALVHVCKTYSNGQ